MSDLINTISENEQKAQTEAKIKDKFNEVHEKQCGLIESFITGGYIEMLAKLLVYVGDKRANDIMSKLPENDRQLLEKSYKAMSDKKNSDPDVLSETGRVLKNAGFYGEASANALLEGLNPNEEDTLVKLLPQLFEINPLLAMNTEMQIYSFDMIANMSDRDIQRMLREIDSIEIAKALKETGDNVKEKIFRNMSRRAADMLKEDMEYMGPTRKSDVLEAQRHIIDIIKLLEKNGEIVIVR